MFGRKRVAELEARLAHVEAALAVPRLPVELVNMGAALEGHTAWLTAIEQGITDLRAAHAEQLRDIGRWLTVTTRTVSELSSTPLISSPDLHALGPKAKLVDDRVPLARAIKVWTMMRWIAQVTFESKTSISVILPTRDRLPYLQRAIASVMAQRHPVFDLVIVDDGSTDGTAEFLSTLADTRIRVLHTSGIGAAAARNLALVAAQGEIVTYLDDDNVMDPSWLFGVAWAFGRWPGTELLYGARIVEDRAAMNGIPSGATPHLEWLPFDRGNLEQSNYIDLNVLAHRSGLSEARFDPALRSSMDWEMLLRLTARRTPLELPVIACLYSNFAPNRLSNLATCSADSNVVRARAHTTRPMRVLCYNAYFPLMSETYIEEEMLALEAHGASIAFVTLGQSASPYPVRQPVFSDYDEAIAAHDPDVVVLYWASHASSVLDQLGRAGRPFALRCHSFDFNIDEIIKIKNHPCCVGVWAFPHHVPTIPGSHELVTILSTHSSIPEPVVPRTVVATFCAALPKKNWPLVFEAMDQLSDLDRILALARTNGHEHVADEVVRLAANRERPPEVKINVPRADVFDILARTSVVLYTKFPDLAFGMPMSIIEGMRAGACVVTPDRPEMRAMCGDGFRPYETAADIVRHVREVMAGGPLIEDERRRNRERAMTLFCAPEIGLRFHNELSAAVNTWKLNR